MPQIASRLADSERWRLFFLRHSHRGGIDYVYPPPGTVDPRYGAVKRPEIYIDAEGKQRVRGSFVGGGAYLFAHDREDPEDYAVRLAQSYVINLCGPIVARYVSTLFRREPTRKVSPREEPLLANIDRRGSDASRFFAKVAAASLVFGTRVFVATDTPEIESRPDGLEVSEAERKELGLEPYSYLVRPTDVLNWATDDDDNLIGIAVDEGPAPHAFDPLSAPKEPPPRRIRVWTPERWDLYHQAASGNAELVKSGTGFGFVPFVPFVFRPVDDGCDYQGRSLIEDVADIQLEIFNELSLLQDLHRHQGSQFLAWPTLLGNGNVDAATEIALSTKHFIEVSGGMPQYIGPSVEHAVEKRNHIAWLVRVAMECVGLIRRGADSKDAASGESLRWEHAEFHDLLSDAADMMEEGERRVLAQREAVATRQQPSAITGIEVAYSRDYEPLDPAAESAALTAELALQLGPETELELRRGYVQRRLGHLGPERLAELSADLEDSAAAVAIARDAAALAAQRDAERPPSRFGRGGPFARMDA